MKITRHGHLKIKKRCLKCGHSNAIMKKNSKNIKCTKCGNIVGFIKDKEEENEE